MRTPLALACVILLVLCPSVLAERIEVDSAHDVQIEGAVQIALPDGQGRIRSGGPGEPFHLDGLTGTARILTWRQISTLDGGIVQPAGGRPEARDIPLRNASLAATPSGDPFDAEIVAVGGTLRLQARTHELGIPVWTSSARAAEVGVDPTGSRPEGVVWSWDQGDTFVGALPSQQGFPRPDATMLRIEGRALIQLDAGEISIVEENGDTVNIRLGVVARDVEGPLTYETRARLVLDAIVVDAHIPLTGAWGFAAPHSNWTLDGQVTWTHASGTYGDASQRFAEETVIAAGRFTIAPTQGTALDGRVHYAGEGDFDRVQVGSAALHATAAPGVPPAAWSLLALVLAAFGAAGPRIAAFVAAPFYTRLAAEQIIAHPVRARILGAVALAPGVHLRELQRRVGGAWGPFTFHVRLLEQAGYVVRRREGRFVGVYAAGSPPSTERRNATQRSILDELPLDGAPVRLARLRGELGISRQLLNHHVGKLESEGLVLRTRAGPDVSIHRLHTPTTVGVKDAHPNALGEQKA